jgi:putative lipoprotein
MRTRQRLMLVVTALYFVGHPVDAQETQPPAAMPQEAPRNNIRQAIHWKQFQYTCGDGAKISVSLTDSLAKVFFQGHQYLMKQTVSADGNRYSDGKVLWWGKGEGGFLQQDTPDGDGTMLAKDCKVDKPAQPEAGVLTGTVTYLQRMALPSQAVIEIKLQDVSLATPQVFVEKKFPAGDHQVPIPFEVKFDLAKIDPKHSYAVSARILVDDKVVFLTDSPYPVLTAGKPSHVEMILRAPRP